MSVKSVVSFDVLVFDYRFAFGLLMPAHKDLAFALLSLQSEGRTLRPQAWTRALSSCAVVHHSGPSLTSVFWDDYD